jgi:ribonuclease-3 family protein
LNKKINQTPEKEQSTQKLQNNFKEQFENQNNQISNEQISINISKALDTSNIYSNFLNLTSPNISLEKVKNVPPLLLAFIGDAVHTLFVRTFFLENVNSPLGTKHKQCSSFCRAKSQAEALDFILKFLDENELDIVKRARNSKNHSASKNTNPEDYKKATSFEAIVGYLYVTNQINKLKLLLMKFMEKK